jgi:hypothetical protein
MSWKAGKSRNAHRYEPYLNGERVPLAFEADVHEGWIRVYIEAPDGTLMLDGLGQLKTLKIWGRVELRKIPEEERNPHG